jgi:mycothiol synthase
LGATVCAAVVARLLSSGYTNIYLNTDDERYPAIKTYLKLGFRPVLLTADMAARWETICNRLAWPFTPEGWRIL